jgi:hypothetical protein
MKWRFAKAADRSKNLFLSSVKIARLHGTKLWRLLTLFPHLSTITCTRNRAQSWPGISDRDMKVFCRRWCLRYSQLHGAITYTRFSSPHSGYMLRPSHPPWLDHSNYTRHEVLKHLQSIFLSQCQRSGFTPILNHRQNYILFISA